MAATVASLLGSPIFKGVSDIIQLFKIPPEQQAQNQLALQQIQLAMLDSAQKAAQAQIDDATANIQAEAKAGSKARPMFMYIVELILLANYLVIPMVHIFTGRAYDPFPLPTNVLILFGVCLTGYTAFDKIMQVMNLPGDSSVSVFGLKVGNKN
jgi:hypothetical protein